MPIAWEAKLAVGVDSIDDQHKELFAQVNALLTAMAERRGRDEVGPMLDFLATYVVQHFRMEEALMRLNRYPDAAAHGERHAGFIADLEKLDARYRKEGASVTLLFQLNGAVCDWLREHVSREDRALGEFLRKRAASA
jgi:hemerythrin